MLKLFRHPPGTTFSCAPFHTGISKREVGGGVVIVHDHEDARPICQKFYGEDDVIRTSAPLDRYGNKTCYHDRAIGEIYLNKGDSLAGYIPMSNARNYPWLDRQQFFARANSGKQCQMVVRGEPLGFSFVNNTDIDASELSSRHSAAYSQNLRIYDFGEFAYMGNAYSSDTVTAHFLNRTGLEIRRLWSLGGEIPVGVQVCRPVYEGGSTLIVFCILLKVASDYGATYAYTFCKTSDNTRWTAESFTGNVDKPTSLSTKYFKDLIAEYHPHSKVVKNDVETYTSEQIFDEMLALSDAVMASPILSEIETEVMSWKKGTKLYVPNYSNSSKTKAYILSPIITSGLGKAGAVQALSRQKKIEINRSISLFNSVCVPSEPPVAWGDLGNECADQVALTDVNVLAYLADLKDFGSSAKSAYKFLKDPANVRSGASAYLSARFGDRLTVSDTKQLFGDLTGKIVEGLSNNVIPTRTRRTTQVAASSLFYPIKSQEVVQCYFAWFQPDDYIGLDRAVSTLMQLGLWLDTKNAWDLVPLSFVVDWFVNVSDFFETIDRWVTNRYFSVVSVCRSAKTTTHLDSSLWRPKYPFLTSVCHVRYFREVTHRLDSTPFCVEWSAPSLVNILDGSALLLQR